MDYIAVEDVLAGLTPTQPHDHPQLLIKESVYLHEKESDEFGNSQAGNI